MKLNLQRRHLIGGLAATACGLHRSALAQSTKPIKLIVPFASGGGTDAVARLVASKLQERTGQVVIVENKPGAGSTLGADAVAKSPPDGQTLLVMTNSFATAAALSKLSYDAERDFTPITTLGTSPYLLLVRADSPLKSVADLVRTGKAQPGKLSFGSAGPGSVTHLMSELFKLRSGFYATHIPYRGSSAALVDLIGGQLDFMFADTASAIAQVKGGKLRALAVTASARSALLPDVPSAKEAGLPVEIVGFYGLLAPARLPAPITAKLHADIAAIVAMPDIRSAFAATMTDAVAVPPEQFARMVSAEIALWRDVVKKSGAKFE